MEKYRIGDHVKIKEEIEDYSDGPGINSDMKEFYGKSGYVTEIRQGHSFARYRLDTDNSTWNWDERWLELPEEKEIKEFDIMEAFNV